MGHAIDPVLSDDFGNGRIGERHAAGRGKEEGTAATGLLGIVQERQGPGGQGHPMLFAGFGSGGRNDPGSFAEVDFLPGRQPHLAGTGRGEDLKLKAPSGGAVGARGLHRGEGLSDLLMGNAFEPLFEGGRVGEGSSEALRRVVGPESLRLGPLHHPAHPVLDPLRGFRFGRPNGIEHRHHVRRCDLGDRLLSDKRERIGTQGGPPELRRLSAILPRGLV